MKKKDFWVYELKWLVRRGVKCICGKKIRTKKYAGRTVYSSEDGNKILYNMTLNSEVTFLACRMGAEENSLVKEYIEKQFGFRREYSKLRRYKIANNAGFFSKYSDEVLDEDMNKLSLLLQESIAKADLIGVWYNPLEDYIINKNCNHDCKLSHREIFDFWNYDVPFTNALKGKKVLVVHPFKETIEKQYRDKRKLLFENENILPEFELYVVQATQTSGLEKYEDKTDWFTELKNMYLKCLKYDFDIALIACGAYGLPLASMLKSRNKSVIHMGGVLQILFGIKGKRWDDHPSASKLYNEHWVRPKENERPERANNIEGGCYW